MMQVFSTRTYERAIRKLLGEEARKQMEEAIVAAPDAAPVIRGDRLLILAHLTEVLATFDGESGVI